MKCARIASNSNFDVRGGRESHYFYYLFQKWNHNQSATWKVFFNYWNSISATVCVQTDFTAWDLTERNEKNALLRCDEKTEIYANVYRVSSFWTHWQISHYNWKELNLKELKSCTASSLMVLGKSLPGKIPTRKISTHQASAWKIPPPPPQKILTQKIPTWNIPTYFINCLSSPCLHLILRP